MGGGACCRRPLDDNRRWTQAVNYLTVDAMPIQSFKDQRCARLLRGDAPGRSFPAELRRRTLNRLRLLDETVVLGDLRDPPGNHLEALGGDRAGQHSIRVNRQFRVCFRWTPDGPADVEFVDYH